MTNLEDKVGRVDPGEPKILPLRTEMRSGCFAVRAEMKALDGKVTDMSRQMRVLHEDVIGRIALLHEDRPKRPNGKRRRRVWLLLEQLM
ncbi:MAG: hypothetical protein M3R55_17590, partial [Acidobacteriota bacterium]|nr:hypothetical protein [Acidobacteriota bacterium]